MLLRRLILLMALALLPAVGWAQSPYINYIPGEPRPVVLYASGTSVPTTGTSLRWFAMGAGLP